MIYDNDTVANKVPEKELEVVEMIMLLWEKFSFLPLSTTKNKLLRFGYVVERDRNYKSGRVSHLQKNSFLYSISDIYFQIVPYEEKKYWINLPKVRLYS